MDVPVFSFVYVVIYIYMVCVCTMYFTYSTYERVETVIVVLYSVNSIQGWVTTHFCTLVRQVMSCVKNNNNKNRLITTTTANTGI